MVWEYYPSGEIETAAITAELRASGEQELAGTGSGQTAKHVTSRKIRARPSITNARGYLDLRP